MGSTLRVVIALFPLAFVPILVQLIATGKLNFGGGEKDLLLVIPWVLWSLIFTVSSFILWHRGWSLWRSIWRSAVFGLGGIVLAAIILATFGQLGVDSRF